MQLNLKRLDEKAVLPVINADGNSFNLTCTAMATGAGKDGRLVLEYRTGIEMEVPEGYVAALFIDDTAYARSLVLTNSVATFLPGKPVELIARFKTNTDSIPAIYEAGEVFAKVIILELPKIEINELEMDIKVKESEILDGKIEEVDEAPTGEQILEAVEING
jgi:dUTP pyrophosphatase